MKWQSEESVQLVEATEWTRHFSELETRMDQLLADYFEISLEQLRSWSHPGKYVSGSELVNQGLAELIDLKN